MKKITLLAVAAFIIVTACEPAMEYRDLNTFEISNELLDNTDEVELIYSTATPKNNGFNAFIHIMAVKKEGGDTINILTTNNTGTGKGDNKNIFKFYLPNSDEGKKYFEKHHNLSGELSDSTLSAITKVVRDPRFDFMTQNSFPAVIGFIEK